MRTFTERPRIIFLGALLLKSPIPKNQINTDRHEKSRSLRCISGSPCFCNYSVVQQCNSATTQQRKQALSGKIRPQERKGPGTARLRRASSPKIRKKYFKLKRNRRPLNVADTLHKTDKCGIIKNNYTFFTFIFSCQLQYNSKILFCQAIF